MPSALEHLVQDRVSALTRDRVAHAESRVPVAPVVALADHLVVGHRRRSGWKRGAHGVLHAVHRPDATVALEVRRVLGVPVLRVDDEAAAATSLLDLGVDRGHDVLAALDVQAPRRVGEVVLHVDHEQGGPSVVGDHRRTGYRSDVPRVLTSPTPGRAGTWDRCGRVHVEVRGRVQGVFFRASCVERARALGVGRLGPQHPRRPGRGRVRGRAARGRGDARVVCRRSAVRRRRAGRGEGSLAHRRARFRVAR